MFTMGQFSIPNHLPEDYMTGSLRKHAPQKHYIDIQLSSGSNHQHYLLCPVRCNIFCYLLREHLLLAYLQILTLRLQGSQ